MKKEFAKNKGITLVALIITIIIMLILVSVTVNIVINSGLLETARRAGRDYQKSEIEDELEMAIASRQIQKYLPNNTETFEQTLKSTFGEEAVEKIVRTTEPETYYTDVYYVTKKGQTFTVYEDGTILDGEVEIWDGSSTESPEFKDFNWYIYNAAQLNFLQKFVNNGNQLTTELTTLLGEKHYTASDVTMTSTTKVNLMSDIDLGARPDLSKTKVEDQWEIAANETKEWTPIGTNKNNVIGILGIFEGNDYTIKGAYASTTTDGFIGIFGNSNTVQNLTIKDSYFKGTFCIGGISGALRAGEMNNCHNVNSTVIGLEDAIGGITGQASSESEGVDSCTNIGTIISYSQDEQQIQAGGIVGLGYDANISNCINYGNVIFKGTGTGTGIGGIVGKTDRGACVSDCHNLGKVEGTKCVGGIVGSASTVVTRCSNTGSVTGTESVGGIVGNSIKKYGQDISLCYNLGTVIGSGVEVGGISGYLGSNGYEGKEYKCYNKGIVTTTASTDQIGGVVGDMGADAEVTNCYYLNSIGVQYGIGTVSNSSVNIETQRAGAKATTYDIKTFDEFLSIMEGDMSVLDD